MPRESTERLKDRIEELESENEALQEENDTLQDRLDSIVEIASEEEGEEDSEGKPEASLRAGWRKEAHEVTESTSQTTAVEFRQAT